MGRVLLSQLARVRQLAFYVIECVVVAVPGYTVAGQALAGDEDVVFMP